MAKTKISEWSSTPGSNTDIDGINLAEGMVPSDVNNALREMMSQIKDLQSANGTYYTADSDAIAVGAGGTGAITAATARTNLGVPSLSGNNTLAGVQTLSALTASSAVATDGSKQLVSITNTGTGNNVLATSPTLVTPVLGTPASGNLANCLGVAKAALPTGSVLQVVNATSSTQVTTSSATYITTGLTATITPLFSTSKILVIANPAVQGAASQNVNITLYKDGANLLSAIGLGYVNAGSQVLNTILNSLYLDSPATTSAITYALYIKTSGGIAYFGVNSSTSTITLMEIAA